MGRKEGDKNAKTVQWELMGEYLTNAGVKRYEELMQQADATEFPKLFLQVIEYFKPKLARKELTGADGKDLIPKKYEVEIVKSNNAGSNPT